MLLAIDIGNTNISFGVFGRNRPVKKFNIPTSGYNIKKLKRSLAQTSVDDAIICSVVPKTTAILNKDVKRLIKRKPYITGKDIVVPIKNLYRKPAEVGQDRLVNAYAAAVFFGAPSVVVDFGTAITFDAVSKNKEYLGGMILPGLRMSLDALYRRTALLPEIKLARPKEFIGGDTRASMLSGVVYGFSGLCDDLIRKIKYRIGKDALVVATGGDINLVSRFCKQFDKIDADLTLKGLNLIYREEIKKKSLKNSE